jgi:large subunit ribosomal protein L25
MKDLDIGGSIHLSQIKMPAGVRVHALMLGEDHDVGVVAIHAPKVDKSAEAESEE